MYNSIRADAALDADASRAQKLHVGLDHRVRADFDLGVDDAGVGPEDGDALRHQLGRGGHAHGAVEVHHLGDGVRAEDLVDTVRLDGYHALAIGYEHRRDVGQVELAVGVVGREGIELAEESFGAEAVNAGVDFGCMGLLRLERLLLDDGRDLRASFAGGA